MSDPAAIAAAEIPAPDLPAPIVAQVRKFIRSRGRTFSLAMNQRGEVFCIGKYSFPYRLACRLEYPLADANLEALGLDRKSSEAPAVLLDVLRHTPAPPPPFNHRRRFARHG